MSGFGHCGLEGGIDEGSGFGLCCYPLCVIWGSRFNTRASPSLGYVLDMVGWMSYGLVLVVRYPMGEFEG